MCWSTKLKKKPKIKIAKRNITCYKLGVTSVSAGRDIFISGIYEYKYVFNKLTKAYRYMNKGFFTKPIVELELIKIKVANHINEYQVYEGIHSYKDKRSSPLADTVKCIIPKGSEYLYEAYFKNYVSNQIIIKEIV